MDVRLTRAFCEEVPGPLQDGDRKYMVYEAKAHVDTKCLPVLYTKEMAEAEVKEIERREYENWQARSLRQEIDKAKREVEFLEKNFTDLVNAQDRARVERRKKLKEKFND